MDGLTKCISHQLAGQNTPGWASANRLQISKHFSSDETHLKNTSGTLNTQHGFKLAASATVAVAALQPELDGRTNV